MWPLICRNKPAINPKWFNSLDTNSIFLSCLGHCPINCATASQTIWHTPQRKIDKGNSIKSVDFRYKINYLLLGSQIELISILGLELFLVFLIKLLKISNEYFGMPYDLTLFWPKLTPVHIGKGKSLKFEWLINQFTNYDDDKEWVKTRIPKYTV